MLEVNSLRFSLSGSIIIKGNSHTVTLVISKMTFKIYILFEHLLQAHKTQIQ